MEHVGAVGRTSVACALTVRAGLCARLHYRMLFQVIRLLFLRLSRLGERNNPDDGKSHGRQTDSAEHSILHDKIPFRKTSLDAGDRNRHLASSDW